MNLASTEKIENDVKDAFIHWTYLTYKTMLVKIDVVLNSAK